VDSIDTILEMVLPHLFKRLLRPPMLHADSIGCNHDAGPITTSLAMYKELPLGIGHQKGQKLRHLTVVRSL
jgi:hypothetical protein